MQFTPYFIIIPISPPFTPTHNGTKKMGGKKEKKKNLDRN